MTTASNPASYLSNTHDADMRAMASKTRAVEIKRLWGGICNAIAGSFRKEAQQPAISTLDRQTPAAQTPMANDERFQKAA